MLFIIGFSWSLLVILFILFISEKKLNKKIKKPSNILSVWALGYKNKLKIIKKIKKIKLYFWKPSFKKNHYTSYLIRYTKWF